MIKPDCLCEDSLPQCIPYFPMGAARPTPDFAENRTIHLERPSHDQAQSMYSPCDPSQVQRPLLEIKVALVICVQIHHSIRASWQMIRRTRDFWFSLEVKEDNGPLKDFRIHAAVIFHFHLPFAAPLVWQESRWENGVDQVPISAACSAGWQEICMN